MRQKAHPLPKSTRCKIGKKKEGHPNLTYGELASQFNCTYEQARRAHHQFRDGHLSGRKRRRNKEVTSGGTLSDLFQSALDNALTSDLNAMESVAAVERLARSRHTIQQLELTGHMKRTDAAIIAQIIRRYEPDADDDKVIAIYREEYALWKDLA